MPDRTSYAVAAAGLALAAAGGFMWWSQPTGATSAGAGTAPPTAASQGEPVAGAPVSPKIVPHRPGAPEQVRIPALHVTAPVVAVRAPNRTLVPPSDPTQLGWWADGAKPGAARGSALITGHTVHTGGGALDDLEDLRRGDSIVVRTDRGTLHYVVQRVHVYSKGRIADDARKLFSQEVRGRLVVITCEDWDGVRYLSNVVVTATPRG